MTAAPTMPIKTGPHIAGMPTLSFFTFVTSGVLGFWLLISILLSGQLK